MWINGPVLGDDQICPTDKVLDWMPLSVLMDTFEEPYTYPPHLTMTHAPFSSAGSRKRIPSRKTLASIAALSCLLIAPLTAQQSRTWTDAKGRSIIGTMVGKNASAAEVRMSNGRIVALKRSDLSVACWKYVEETAIQTVPKMTARTVAVRSNEAGTKLDMRALEIECSQLGEGIDYEVVIIWLGDGPGSGKYGVWKTNKQAATAGKEVFKTVYNGTRYDFGTNFRGWVAGLRDSNGKWLARTASIKPYERFLDEL